MIFLGVSKPKVPSRIDKNRALDRLTVVYNCINCNLNISNKLGQWQNSDHWADATNSPQQRYRSSDISNHICFWVE